MFIMLNWFIWIIMAHGTQLLTPEDIVLAGSEECLMEKDPQNIKIDEVSACYNAHALLNCGNMWYMMQICLTSSPMVWQPLKNKTGRDLFQDSCKNCFNPGLLLYVVHKLKLTRFLYHFQISFITIIHILQTILTLDEM